MKKKINVVKVKKTVAKAPAKKDDVKKPMQLKEVKVTATRINKPKLDSMSVGLGTNKKNFALKDVKSAIKANTLKGDTTSNRSLLSSVGGRTSSDDVDAAIRLAKFKQNKKK